LITISASIDYRKTTQKAYGYNGMNLLLDIVEGKDIKKENYSPYKIIIPSPLPVFLFKKFSSKLSVILCY